MSSPSSTAPIFDSRDRVVVLTPCYGGQVTDTYLNALAACREVTAWFRMPDGSCQELPIIADRISLVSESHIDRGRNALTNLWVDNYENRNGPRKCLWWDADVELTPPLFMHLYIQCAKPVQGAKPGVGGNAFVCGAYAMKILCPTFVANIKHGTAPDPVTGLVEVMHSGTGCMMWDISVPYKLREHGQVKPYASAPNSPWPNAKHYAYFSSGPYGEKDPSTGLQQWQSEDWMVCMLWQELGEKVFLDTQVKLRHAGQLVYPPQITDLEQGYLAMVRQNHPAVNIAAAREAISGYRAPEQKAA